MEGGSDYQLAWWIYLCAVLGAHCLLWWLLRPVTYTNVKAVLQLMLLALLITPAALEPGQSYWVPAFMAAFMDGVDSGIDAALVRLWPIFGAMLLFLLLFVLVKVLWARRRGGSTAPKNSR